MALAWCKKLSWSLGISVLECWLSELGRQNYGWLAHISNDVCIDVNIKIATMIAALHNSYKAGSSGFQRMMLFCKRTYPQHCKFYCNIYSQCKLSLLIPFAQNQQQKKWVLVHQCTVITTWKYNFWLEWWTLMWKNSAWIINTKPKVLLNVVDLDLQTSTSHICKAPWHLQKHITNAKSPRTENIIIINKK